MAILLAVNVGMPRHVPWQGRTVYTGVWKEPATGPRMVRRLNIDGDGQGDARGHGGEQRAVLVYQAQSYEHWRRFGENLTVDGLPDDEVCIGDRYRIGEAEFEVTQPRVLLLGDFHAPRPLGGPAIHHRRDRVSRCGR